MPDRHLIAFPCPVSHRKCASHHNYTIWKCACTSPCVLDPYSFKLLLVTSGATMIPPVTYCQTFDADKQSSIPICHCWILEESCCRDQWCRKMTSRNTAYCQLGHQSLNSSERKHNVSLISIRY